MFEIVNTPRDYSWGSTTAIPEILGVPATGQPAAELWLGDHPGSPARVRATGQSLIQWRESHPESFGGTSLPFLVKLLAAETPLSIQAHPSKAHAERRFADEESAGISLDSPVRNYRDANHKPEIIIAMTEFSALCGFRPRADRDRVLAAVEQLGVPRATELRDRTSIGLAHVLDWLLTRGEGVAELVDGLCASHPPTGDVTVDDAVETARTIGSRFPGDPGVAVSLLLNHVVLQPGEALYLPAGNVHAYVHGVGVEVMASSDNVLRGGLTTKHIDVPELLSVLDFTELAEPRLAPLENGPIRTFDPGIDDFLVTEVRAVGSVDLAIDGPAIGIVTEGDITLLADSECTLPRGAAVFLPAGEKLRHISGKGVIYLASRPNRTKLKP